MKKINNKKNGGGFQVFFGWFGVARARFRAKKNLKNKFRKSVFFHWGNLPDWPGPKTNKKKSKN